jgi:high affinity sulfate transporter 1
VAGLVVAAYLVPQCMAYARLAGLPAVTGLWAVPVPLVAYALLGTSSRLSVGPDSTSALLAGSAAASLAAATGANPAKLAAALAMAVAAVAFVAWFARLGFLADLLSRPVITGYMAGVAVFMIAGQLPNLTGVPASERHTIPRLVEAASRLGELRPAPLILGLSLVAFLTATNRIRRLPGPLIGVLAATAATAWFHLDTYGVATVGPVPRGLPHLAWPSIPAGAWPAALAAATGIWVVAYSDQVLTARAFASRSGDRVDANQELLALAAANAGAGLSGGFPIAASASRTAIAEAAGGTTQLTSLVAAAIVVGVLLAAGGLLGKFPLAALAALVLYAAGRLIEPSEIRRIAGFRPSELIPATAAFVGVVAFDTIIGIGLAVALSVLELFARVARAHDGILGRVPGLAGLHDIDDWPAAETIPGLVVYRYDAPLCFANTEHFRTRLLAAVDAEIHPVEWVLLNMEANVEIDFTAACMLMELHGELRRRGIELALARVKQDLLRYLKRCGLADAVGPDRIFPTLPTALAAFEARHDPVPNRDQV